MLQETAGAAGVGKAAGREGGDASRTSQASRQDVGWDEETGDWVA